VEMGVCYGFYFFLILQINSLGISFTTEIWVES